MTAARRTTRVLLVSPEHSELREYYGRLASRGYEVRTAAPGPGCLDAIRRREVDLILLDAQYGGSDRDVLELRRELRSQNEPVRAFIVLVSPLPIRPGLPVDGYIVQPCDTESFEAQLQVLARAQLEQDSLLREQQRYRVLAEQSPFGIAMIDASGRYIYVNPRFTEMLGYTLEDIGRGKTWFRLAYPDPPYRSLVIKTWSQDLKRSEREQPRPRTYTVTCKDGSTKIIHFRPLTLSDGMQLVFYEDITDRYLAEEALRHSEAKYRELAEMLPEVVFETDEKGKLTFVNRNSFRFFGYDEEDFRRGLNAFKLIAPCDRDRARSNFQSILLGRQDRVNSYTALRKNGQTFPISVHSTAIVHDGVPAGVRGFVIDETQRQETERALRESEERFHQLFANMTNGVAIWQAEADGENFILRDLNDSGAKLCKVRKEDVIGKRATEAFPDIVEFGLLDVLRDVHKTGRAEHHPTRLYDDGKLVAWFENNVCRLPNGDVAAVFENVTERKRLEQQLLHSQKMQALGKLAGGIAHDFRNQLTVIQWCAQRLISRSLVNDEGREEVEEIVKAADQSRKLVGQLLAFGRREVLQPQQVELDDLVVQLGSSLQRAVGEKISLQVVPSGQDCYVQLDRAQFQQALMNLAINARDAMPEGGSLTLTVKCIQLDEATAAHHQVGPGPFALLEVADTGIGMDEATRARAFDPFFTTKDVGKGTGLGLSMVYGFVSQSNGFIEVDSKPGCGSVFRLYFPRLETVRCKATPEFPLAARLNAPGTVVLVEDESPLRRLLEATLKEAGYTVLGTDNPDEALSIVRRHGRIELLVTDVVMPRMSGPQLAAVLRREYPDVPVLFISGYPGAELERHGLDQYHPNLLPKPFSKDQFLDRVRRAIGSHAGAVEHPAAAGQIR